MTCQTYIAIPMGGGSYRLSQKAPLSFRRGVGGEGMASQWFYQVMGEQVGPVSSTQLRNLALRAAISSDTLVRKAPDGTWVPAERVQGLFPVPNVTPPPMAVTVSAPVDTVEVVLAEFVEAQPTDSPPASKPGHPNATAVTTRSWLHSELLPEQSWLRRPVFWVLLLSPLILLLLPLIIVFGIVFGAPIAPAIIVWRRNHPHLRAIVVLNIFFACVWYPFLLQAINADMNIDEMMIPWMAIPGLFWLVALVWACMYERGGNCWRCNGRQNGFPQVCRFCHTELSWSDGKSIKPPSQ